MRCRYLDDFRRGIRYFQGVCVIPSCVTVSTFYALYAKTSKVNFAFTSLDGLLFNCPSWISLRYNNSIYQVVIFSFKVSPNFIVYESAEDRNLRVIFNRAKKMHYLAIFLPNSIATRMPYLPAKDELVSLDRLSSWELYKWYNSKGFGPATIWRGAAFHFLAVFSKMKILWKLWLWFSKMFHQRVLSDWKWSISKFQFWRRILNHTDSRS